MISKRARELFEWIRKDGEQAIDQLIADRKAEELFLDFKLSSNRGSSNNLSEDDRNNYERAISGFGNSEGGILIWGVDSKSIDKGKNIDQCKFPLKDSIRFVRNLNHIGSGRTVPPHSEIENHEVIVGDDNEGFIVSYIPKCNIAPIQTVSRDFLVRIGSNFEKASYSYLASQFGKRPEPIMFLMYLEPRPSIQPDNSISFSIGINVFNGGVNYLKNTYLNFRVFHALNHERFFVNLLDRANWYNYSQIGRLMTYVCKDSFAIAPYSSITPIQMTFIVSEPIIEGIKIELTYGCEGSHIHHGMIENSKENIISIYQSELVSFIAQFKKNGQLSAIEMNQLRDIMRRMIPLPKEFGTFTSYEEVKHTPSS